MSCEGYASDVGRRSYAMAGKNVVFYIALCRQHPACSARNLPSAGPLPSPPSVLYPVPRSGDEHTFRAPSLVCFETTNTPPHPSCSVYHLPQVDGGRVIRVTFDGGTADTMPWKFRPTQGDVKARISTAKQA